METLLTTFWEVEDLTCRVVKETDKLYEDIFVRTTTRSCDGKYIVSLPFKDSEHIDLGYSRSSAQAQFLRNETRLKKEPVLKDTYDSVIDLGHMKPVPPNTDTINFYLSHHAVFKPETTRKYTFEELSTLLAKIEAFLNSRPLAPMSEDPTDLLALTPSHFLVGGPLLATVEPEIKGASTSIINRWQHLKALHHQFRLRWKEEYLKELHKRTKWQVPTRNLNVGEMGIIKDDNLPSNEWRLGRNDFVFPGLDGHVRVLNIRTARGIF
ncbi:uncharacterized protein [Drosophila kikkawai]|uniref:DUF5641 domain-containing protein n=1 Tax=Drosophila kikkawai TaxID=30033 RepID=A0ABM4GHB5_DROKI